MEIICLRKPSKNSATIGELSIDGQFVCYTLEDQIREIGGQPVDKWKVTGETAIPGGRYKLTLENSPRFGAETMTVNNVPGFVGVRVHGGNKHQDTEGCPLLGLSVSDDKIVGGTSKPAVEKVKALVKSALAKKEEVWWVTKNPQIIMT